jgi:hypothetical protein
MDMAQKWVMFRIPAVQVPGCVWQKPKQLFESDMNGTG